MGFHQLEGILVGLRELKMKVHELDLDEIENSLWSMVGLCADLR